VVTPNGTSTTFAADQFTYKATVAGCSIVGTGDFTGSGKADVLWENQSTGSVGAWITDPTGVSWLGLGTV